MLDDNRKPERPEIDPANIERLIEIELMQKRASWQQAKARRGGVRALCYLFLFIVILAALAGFFIFLTPDRVQELKSSAAQQTEPTPSSDPLRR